MHFEARTYNVTINLWLKYSYRASTVSPRKTDKGGDEPMNKQKDGGTDKLKQKPEKWTTKPLGRPTDRQLNGQTDGHADKWLDRQMDVGKHRWTNPARWMDNTTTGKPNDGQIGGQRMLDNWKNKWMDQ